MITSIHTHNEITPLESPFLFFLYLLKKMKKFCFKKKIKTVKRVIQSLNFTSKSENYSHDEIKNFFFSIIKKKNLKSKKISSNTIQNKIFYFYHNSTSFLLNFYSELTLHLIMLNEPL